LKKGLIGFAVAAIATALLAGCGSNKAEISIEDPVVRSIDAMSYKDDAGKYMTGSFMTIKNSGGEDVTLVGGSTDIADRIEIHEVIDGVMQPMGEGLVIKAGESVKLRMGGYHVMLIGLNKDLKAGDEATVTLEFSDGQSIDYTAPVKDIAMDDEQYGAAGMGDGAMK
jgi:periplasmic copper chaperone A